MSLWRARIGKISPSRGDAYTYEFYKVVPDKVLLTNIATGVRQLTPDNFSRAFGLYLDAAVTLAEEGAQFLIVGGGPVLVSQGPETEDRLREQIQKATSLPMTTEFSAPAEACRPLGIRRLGIISPYLEGLNGLVKAYFERKGLEVPVIRGLGIEKNIEIGKLPEDAAFDLTMKTFREGPEVDGYYLTCSRWLTVSSIAPLEEATGKPVISSIQAGIWKAFQSLGIKDPITRYGKLLASLAD